MTFTGCFDVLARSLTMLGGAFVLGGFVWAAIDFLVQRRRERRRALEEIMRRLARAP